MSARIARIAQRSPTMLVPTPVKPGVALTASQRKSMCLGVPKAPRVREPGEATSTVICNSTTTAAYRTGDGEVGQQIRPGADDHMAHPSRFIGVRTWRDGRVQQREAQS